MLSYKIHHDEDTEEDSENNLVFPQKRKLPPRPRSNRKRIKPANFQDQITMSDMDNLTDLAELTAGEEIARLPHKNETTDEEEESSGNQEKFYDETPGEYRRNKYIANIDKWREIQECINTDLETAIKMDIQLDEEWRKKRGQPRNTNYFPHGMLSKSNIGHILFK